jgi:hypothetical protein
MEDTAARSSLLANKFIQLLAVGASPVTALVFIELPNPQHTALHKATLKCLQSNTFNHAPLSVNALLQMNIPLCHKRSFNAKSLFYRQTFRIFINKGEIRNCA